MKRTKMQEIALERICRLFELAGNEFAEHPERSRRYVEIAREISKKARQRIPKELKARFCKKCGEYLEKGKNSEETKEGAMLIVKCLSCGKETKTGEKPKVN